MQPFRRQPGKISQISQINIHIFKKKSTKYLVPVSPFTHKFRIVYLTDVVIQFIWYISQIIY